ncbi:MAG TPA: hypothetical protein PLG59_19385 [bacterium]|nr:hypothetical protein [bacterium]HQQ01035.1 hypothetical protein [bacterium]
MSSVQNAISTLKKINLVIEQEGRDNLRTLFIVGLPKKCAFSVDSRVHETTRSRTPGERSRTPDERERSPDDTALYSSLDSSLDESLEHTSISSEPSFDQDRRNEYKDRTAESTGCDDGFERFWRVYPNQIGKLAARKAWDALNPSENLVSKIIEAVKRQQCWDRWREQDGRFIPAPASWLEQQRWNDVGSPMDERKWKSIRDWGHESRKEQ